MNDSEMNILVQGFMYMEVEFLGCMERNAPDVLQFAGALKVYVQERKSDSENPTLSESIHRKHPNRETHRRK